ncbi:hypothetical protein B0A49_11906 [Cryomyces minteri]|uniref:Uncharacterized protein n=1 Tax=Cryomyces minteri TaxID=331657 RepID=A0A4V5NDI9_9PEZI|nr:hypothetical protein B0A49_11906 [Cryomyces minteri]
MARSGGNQRGDANPINVGSRLPLSDGHVSVGVPAIKTKNPATLLLQRDAVSEIDARSEGSSLSAAMNKAFKPVAHAHRHKLVKTIEARIKLDLKESLPYAFLPKAQIIGSDGRFEVRDPVDWPQPLLERLSALSNIVGTRWSFASRLIIDSVRTGQAADFTRMVTVEDVEEAIVIARSAYNINRKHGKARAGATTTTASRLQLELPTPDTSSRSSSLSVNTSGSRDDSHMPRSVVNPMPLTNSSSSLLRPSSMKKRKSSPPVDPRFRKQVKWAEEHGFVNPCNDRAPVQPRRALITSQTQYSFPFPGLGNLGPRLDLPHSNSASAPSTAAAIRSDTHAQEPSIATASINEATSNSTATAASNTLGNPTFGHITTSVHKATPGHEATNGRGAPSAILSSRFSGFVCDESDDVEIVELKLKVAEARARVAEKRVRGAEEVAEAQAQVAEKRVQLAELDAEIAEMKLALQQARMKRAKEADPK